jgi:biotin operon repressor
VEALKQLKETGVTAFTAKELGYVLMELRLAGYVKGIKRAGYTCAEAKQAGYVEGLKQAGYTCAEAKQAGYVQGLKQAGYTCAEAKQAGYVEGLKQAGYTCAEAKQAGYVQGLKQAGYTCAEAKQAGYTCAEMKQAGFNPRECMKGGFTFEEGEAAGYRRHIHRGVYDMPHDYTHQHWDQGQPPPRTERRLTLAARALCLRARPSARRGAGRGLSRAAARAARALLAARRRGKPALPTHARSCSWRARVAAQEIMTGMGNHFASLASLALYNTMGVPGMYTSRSRAERCGCRRPYQTGARRDRNSMAHGAACH